MDDRVAEPKVERMAAAVAGRRRVLRLAVRAVARTEETDVEMVVVAVPGPHLGEPCAVGAGVAAQRLLDRRVDEDALDVRTLGRRLDDGGMRRRPDSRNVV